jgi:UDP-N-acetylmuramyl pentapeptide phosphotransferase/UDP-N-acetylglucosamine-1-phosphate transferase
MLLVAIILSFLISFFTFPVIIRVFKSINLVDSPNKRKIHKLNIPSMGGIAIYLGVMLTIIFFGSLEALQMNKFLLAGLVIIFLLGIRDDISSLYANQKFVVQIVAALLAVHYAGIKLTGFYGLAGINEMPESFNLIFSMLVIIAITNAFNLIDGIDGLAGSIGILASTIFGLWFLSIGMSFQALLSLSLAASLVAFLVYNWHPSKIFMGDTGSLPTGFLLACLSIIFINSQLEYSQQSFNGFIPLVLAILIVPVYDTIRVMIIRVFDGKSPFSPDKKHIHHILLRQGMNHAQSTMILLAFNGGLILLTFVFRNTSDVLLIGGQTILTVAFGAYLDRRLVKYLKKRAHALGRRSLIVSKSA